ncbi:F-box only protein 43-like [Megalops cyprinoides]|uniref:F-box only protein 43-like n=1 Tax=Megalops cyprinoides TaxID=118141 RepID=UPI001863A10A|nr:F-box only protein 43-like [Megalops cyprinoides]
MKKENAYSSGWCETPKTSRKDASLRRRLLVSNAASGGRIGNANSSNRRYSSGSFDSPDSRLFEALATSTLKNEEMSLSCRKRRLMFSQVKTSTLEDGKDKAAQPLASEAEGAEALAVQGELNDSIISSFPHHLSPAFLETQCLCTFTPSAKQNFQTPVRNPASNPSDGTHVLGSPSLTPIPKLDISASEDSGFSSLGLDKSQESTLDHEGSFQELLLPSALRGKETPKVAEARKRSRLERQRRLSTLKEGGSQSEEDARPAEPACAEARLCLDEQKALTAEEDDELFLDKTPIGTTCLKLEDLSLTPALQVVHAMCQRSAGRLPEQMSLEELLRSSEGAQSFQTTMPLAGLIGRKMGLEKLDILVELKRRNLRHVLAKILNHLSSEDIYRFGQVSDLWDEIILQDKMTNRRRKSYLKDLKMAHELGGVAHVPDAETRLNLLCRSALRSVQAQSKTPVSHTPTSGNGNFTPVQHKGCSVSKRDEFLQVAKTLFNDECLKPCPRCQHPARCHSVKREGVCSREDCGFRFCTGCLCAYHGSKECGSWSGKRRGKREVLPGSAQSKRNLRRL